MDGSKNQLMLEWQKRQRRFALRYLIAVGLMLLLHVAMFFYLYINLKSLDSPQQPGSTDSVLDFLVVGILVLGVIFYALASIASFFIVLAVGVITTVYAVFIFVPVLVGCIGLLKNKRWSRVAILVTGIIQLLFFPIGTIIGIFAIHFYLKYRKHKRQLNVHLLRKG